MPAAVSTRYARALVDAALSPAAKVEPQDVARQLRSFETLLSESAELTNVLLSPAVSPARKRAVVDRLVSSLGLARIPRNFLMVLIDHRRTTDLHNVIGAFEKLLNDRLGVLEVQVTSARELSEPQRQALIQGLASATGKVVTLKAAVDRSLIGGVVARIGSAVYDGSVRGRLETLGRRLAQ